MTLNWEFKQTERDYVPPSGPRGEYTFTDEVGLTYRVYTGYGTSRWYWYVSGILVPSGASVMAHGDADNADVAKERARMAGQELRARSIFGRDIPAPVAPTATGDGT